MECKFKLNDVLKDNVSGYTGHVLGITLYATGCIHYGLAALNVGTDGKPMEWQWFDESRCIFVRRGKVPAKSKPHSGPDMNQRCY
jgi:hypothetical protein